MITQTTPRAVLRMLGKHLRAFALALATPLVAYCLLVLPQPSQYESSASIMVKVVDQETAAPDSLSEQQGRSATSFANMAKQIINSELVIIASDDVRKSALSRAGVDRVYPQLAARAQSPVELLDLASERMLKDLSLQVNADTNVIMLALANTDPHVARRTLEALIAATMDKQAAVMRDPRLTFLQRKLTSLRADAERAQRELLRFKQRTQITSFDEERSLLLNQRDGIELSLSELKTQFIAAQGRASSLNDSLKGTPREIALSDENDRGLAQLDQAQARITSAQARYDIAKRRFTPTNPELLDHEAELKAAQAEYDRIRAQSTNRVRTGLNPLNQQLTGGISASRSDATANLGAVKERERQLEAIKARLAYLDSNEMPLRDLEHRRMIADQEYRSYFERAQAARIVSDMNEAGITNLSVVQSPTLPFRASRPRRLLLLAVALLCGLFAGLGLCMLLEMANETVATPDELEHALELPVLASIRFTEG